MLKKLGTTSETNGKKNQEITELKDGNYVGALQTLFQRNHLDLPSYEVKPLSSNHFVCTVKIKGDELMATGTNSKNARQKAAKLMWEKLNNKIS